MFSTQIDNVPNQRSGKRPASTNPNLKEEENKENLINGPAAVVAKAEADNAACDNFLFSKLVKRVENLEQESVITSKKVASIEQILDWTYLLNNTAPLAIKVLKKMQQWKDKQEYGKAHPLGPARAMVGVGIVEWIEENYPENYKEFLEYHAKLSGDVQQVGKYSLAYAVAKETRKGEVLLKLRPQKKAEAVWKPILDFIGEIIEPCWDSAPPTTTQRAIKAQVASNHKHSKGKSKQ